MNDVANSIMDGADAVMLSGETSVGAFPNEVIQKMREIIRSVEHSTIDRSSKKAPKMRDRNDLFRMQFVIKQQFNGR